MGKIKTKILVANDEQIILDLIARILTEEGYEVDTVVNGEKALAKLVNNLYSLIMLDIHMPGKTGIEVYEQIKIRYQSSATKYIFMTSVSNYERKELRASILKTGISCIIMPFDAKQLVKEVNLLLNS